MRKGTNKRKPNYNKSKAEDFKSKSTRRDLEEGYTKDRQSSSNDWRWYASNPSLLAGSNLPFNYAAGTTIRMSYEMKDNVGATIGDDPSLDGRFVFGGLQTIEVVPSVGLSDSEKSPINIAAFQLWVKTRKNKASYSPYNAVSEMLYVRAMADVYSYITYLMRVYGMVTTMFNQSNRFMPRVFLAANGVKPEVSQTEIAQFRYGINLLITKASSFTVPADLPIFTRAAFMYQNIYKEGTSSKDQMYMYTPISFLQLAWEDDPQGSTQRPPVYLKQLPFMYDSSNARQQYTLQELLDYGNQLISPLIGDEDINMMGADILAAFEGNIIRLATLPEFYPIEPFFDIAVLEQMKNATIVATPNMFPLMLGYINQGAWNITESANAQYIECNPQVDSQAAISGESNMPEQSHRILAQASRILTTTTKDVGPDIVLESTRLMSVFKKTVPGQEYDFKLIHGSEIALMCYFWSYQVDTSNVVNTPYYGFNYCYYDDGSTPTSVPSVSQNTQNNLVLRSHVEGSMFRFKPAQFITNINPGSTIAGVRNVRFKFDVDNYTAVHSTDLERVHETALMSLYGVQ